MSFCGLRFMVGLQCFVVMYFFFVNSQGCHHSNQQSTSFSGSCEVYVSLWEGNRGQNWNDPDGWLRLVAIVFGSCLVGELPSESLWLMKPGILYE